MVYLICCSNLKSSRQNIYFCSRLVICFCYLSWGLARWVKFSADDILKYFLFFPENMLWQSLLSEEKENIIILSSAEFVPRVVKIKKEKNLCEN